MNLKVIKKEDGFTVLEVISVVFILAIVIGISSFGLACHINNSNYYELKDNANSLFVKMDNYTMHHDNLPLKEGSQQNLPTEMAEKVAIDILGTDTDERYDDLNDILRNGNVLYEVDLDKLNEVENNYEDFLILNISDDTNILRTYNGTLITKREIESCSGDVMLNFRGLNRDFDMPSSLNYEIPDEFINDPT